MTPAYISRWSIGFQHDYWHGLDRPGRRMALMPISTMVLLGESASPSQLVGLVAILIGITLTRNRAPRLQQE